MRTWLKLYCPVPDGAGDQWFFALPRDVKLWNTVRPVERLVSRVSRAQRQASHTKTAGDLVSAWCGGSLSSDDRTNHTGARPHTSLELGWCGGSLARWAEQFAL